MAILYSLDVELDFKFKQKKESVQLLSFESISLKEHTVISGLVAARFDYNV